MAVGKSHRIVIEVDPDLKKKIYDSLKDRGMTLKEWFIQTAKEDLLSGEQKGCKNGEE